VKQTAQSNTKVTYASSRRGAPLRAGTTLHFTVAWFHTQSICVSRGTAEWSGLNTATHYLARPLFVEREYGLPLWREAKYHIVK
jgi:hypothetical protein